jgi:hypothetical protein
MGSDSMNLSSRGDHYTVGNRVACPAAAVNVEGGISNERDFMPFGESSAAR